MNTQFDMDADNVFSIFFWSFTLKHISTHSMYKKLIFEKFYFLFFYAYSPYHWMWGSISPSRAEVEWTIDGDANNVQADLPTVCGIWLLLSHFLEEWEVRHINQKLRKRRIHWYKGNSMYCQGIVFKKTHGTGAVLWNISTLGTR